MNVNIYYIKDYQIFIPLAGFKNKPKTNPISKRPKLNVNSPITKNYRKKDDFVVRINKPNSNPISSKPKMSANVYIIEDYENETAFRPKKTNPNKPNFRKAKMKLKSLARKSVPFQQTQKKS